MNYVQHVEEERRLVILRFVASGNGSANDRMILSALHAWGIRCTLDVANHSIAWLVEHGLLVTSPVPGSRVRVAEITRRGRDVAGGLAEVPGVTPRRLVAE